MIKVLIVDDSKFIRFNLEQMFPNVSDIQVVGTARNGVEALDFLKQNSVDVVILDFFMPKMDGLETLAEIMTHHMIPTIMITIANQSEHADLYFSALKLGAFEIIPKPTGRDSLYVDTLAETLKDRIRAAYHAKPKISEVNKNHEVLKEILEKGKKVIDEINRKQQEYEQSRAVDFQKTQRSLPNQNLSSFSIPSVRSPDQVPSGFISPCNLLVIGASTGGPGKIIELLSVFSRKMNTITVIVQHMPSGFTYHFAERLNTINNHHCSEAKHGELLIPGNCYVAPGDYHLRFALSGSDIYCVLDQEERINGLRPAIDYTFISGAYVFRKRMVGVVLTGMGNDGSEGVKHIKQVGGIVIVQSLEEALISSMPEKALRTNCVDHIAPVNEIGKILNRLL